LAHLGHDDRPGQLAQRVTHGALRRGAGSGGVRASARRAGQACPASTRGEQTRGGARMQAPDPPKGTDELAFNTQNAENKQI